MRDNKNDNQISLHKFPSEISVKKKWICRLRIGKQLPKNAAVCSSHFRVEDFTSIRRKNNHSMLYIVPGMLSRFLKLKLKLKTEDLELNSLS